jgi:hypothetical protein
MKSRLFILMDWAFYKFDSKDAIAFVFFAQFFQTASCSENSICRRGDLPVHVDYIAAIAAKPREREPGRLSVRTGLEARPHSIRASPDAPQRRVSGR